MIQTFWAIVNRKTKEVIREGGMYDMYPVMYEDKDGCEAHYHDHYKGLLETYEIKEVKVEVI